MNCRLKRTTTTHHKVRIWSGHRPRHCRANEPEALRSVGWRKRAESHRAAWDYPVQLPTESDQVGIRSARGRPRVLDSSVSLSIRRTRPQSSTTSRAVWLGHCSTRSSCSTPHRYCSRSPARIECRLVCSSGTGTGPCTVCRQHRRGASDFARTSSS